MLGCVVVPSLNRPKKLQRLVDSLHGFPVIVSEETQPRALPRIYWELLRGAFMSGGFDFAAMASDHVVLNREILERLDAEFLVDMDRLIGIPIAGQEGGEVSEYRLMAIGRDFYERFREEDYQVHCPDYWHLHANVELGRFAQKVGRFSMLPAEFKAKDFHPNFGTSKVDATYVTSRMYKRAEGKVAAYRRKSDFLWGLNWDRVNLKGYR